MRLLGYACVQQTPADCFVDTLRTATDVLSIYASGGRTRRLADYLNLGSDS